MANIDNLLKSISEMSDNELESRIIDVRKSIRTKKAGKKVSSAKQSQPKGDNLISLLTGMSPEDKAALVAELENL